MKYLVYKQKGFSKKYPLDQPVTRIGRDKQNDLVVADEFVSREHLQVVVGADGILVEDRGSENGFRFKNRRVKKAEVAVGEAFTAGDTQFLLQEGDDDDFALSKDVQAMVRIRNLKPSGGGSARTRSNESVFLELEKEMLTAGLKAGSFNDFTASLAKNLGRIPDLGALLLVTPGEALNIHFTVNDDGGAIAQLNELLNREPGFFAAAGVQDRKKKHELLVSFPLMLGEDPSFLLHFPKQSALVEGERVEMFLESLSGKIETLYRVIGERQIRRKITGEKTDAPDEIVTNNSQMKDLINQAKKIAASDIFILISGESGTGKELFARLIHHFSKRSANSFVALNCAAIPENLLESELFGHDKGAFTGAYTQKKGKLELASGGTLVLDEIGDMPLTLQSKLLRALQEHEFYRLGGNTPIKVDLRIISLTHRNLEQLIEEKKFREDLYYRLVHRAIEVPPLRERKDDIPVLINFFTGKFCSRRKRCINGYSIKAMNALVSFHWPGNVRQLENELNSIINLTDDGETIDFDILSLRIKSKFLDDNAGNKDPGDEKPVQDEPGNDATDGEPRVFYKKPGREEIIRALEDHGWNKSHAAAALNMTYHGLHKKMKKLKISKS